MKSIPDLNDEKASGVGIDESLNKFSDAVLFPEKVEKAKLAFEKFEKAEKPGVSKLKPRSLFISHHHSDIRFVEALENRLQQKGLEVWMDSGKLSTGDDWKNKIDNAIKKSSVLIVVISPDAIQSEYVTFEWSFAMGRGIPVIPILLKKTALHPRLAMLQYLDFRSNQARQWDELYKQLGKYADSAV